ARLHVPTGAAPAVDRRFAAAVTALSLAALAGFVLPPHDLGWVALAAGGVGALGALAARRFTPRQALAAAGPPVLVFALGIFLLVDAVERHGWRRFLLEHAPHATEGTALLAAGLANLINNLPATLVGLPLARDVDHAHALLLGVDVGPNLALTGSLATLLWLTLARERDAGVAATRFLPLGPGPAPRGPAARPPPLGAPSCPARGAAA